MTRTNLAGFAGVLRAKQIELSRSGRSLDSIVIERSADVLEEAQYKSARELAGLNREASVRRGVAMALARNSEQHLRLVRVLRRRDKPAPLGRCTLDPVLHPMPGSRRSRRESVLGSIEQPFLGAA